MQNVFALQTVKQPSWCLQFKFDFMSGTVRINTKMCL